MLVTTAAETQVVHVVVAVYREVVLALDEKLDIGEAAVLIEGAGSMMKGTDVCVTASGVDKTAAWQLKENRSTRAKARK